MNTSSLQGKLILDSGKLIGSYFDRTVILVCRHDESGAFGLVLNRPLKRSLGSVVTLPLDDDLSKTSLYMGGPVQPEAFSFLIETDTRPEFEILPQLVLGHSLEELKHHFATKQSCRAYAFSGYSGWSPGQLEEEMKNGCWLTHPASLSLIFSPKPETLWGDILRQKGGFYELLASTPDDPSLN